MPAPPAPPASHVPVLAAQTVSQLLTAPDGVYVDATFGRGGHARQVLARLGAGGRLIAFDRDPQAQAAAAAIGDPRFTFVSARFSALTVELAERGVAEIDGLLLDLGISSPQIDDPARGFSLRGDGPLDMRMDPRQGESAAQWLSRAEPGEITRVLREHGDERFAASIAKAIVARREAGRAVATTAELAAVVAGAIPFRDRRDPLQHPATRTFQAVRIFINQELEELALTLDQSIPLLRPGGRLLAISFHSLEDRIVKRFIEAHAHPDRALPRLPLRASELPAPRLRALARIAPDAAECAANPRSRSALLRVAERTAAPAAPQFPAGRR